MISFDNHIFYMYNQADDKSYINNSFDSVIINRGVNREHTCRKSYIRNYPWIYGLNYSRLPDNRKK